MLSFSISAVTADLKIVPVGRFDFRTDHAEVVPDGLSGIAYLGNDEYFAVSDARAYLHKLRIEVDPSTGAVRSAQMLKGVHLTDGDGNPMLEGEHKDREGIAIDLAARKVLIANERCGAEMEGTCIDVHNYENGRLIERIGPHSSMRLGVFRHIVSNFGFEAITRHPDGREVWTANEGPLTIDGPKATVRQGALLRLQRLDGELQPLEQYAYRTDPIARPILTPERARAWAGSRIAGLLSLPHGELLAMESVFEGDAEGVIRTVVRIYQVDTRGATDVSHQRFAAGLAGTEFRPVQKQRLVELVFDVFGSNFEDLTLGPRLANGDRSLLLVLDNQRGPQQSLYSLRIAGVD